MPEGGTTGQILAKKSNEDNDTEWVDNVGGGGGDSLPTGSVIEYEGDTIPEGYEEVGSENDYSTEETFTGKYWINGKKIYRKVITGIIPAKGTFLGVNLNYETLTFERLSFVSSSGYTVTNGTFDNVCLLSYMIGLNTIYFSTVGTGFEGREFTLIAEYTKTTD